MAKTPDQAKASQVAEFLRRIDRTDDVRALARDASRIAETISPAELEAAQRRLLDDGYAPAAVSQLSTAFLLMRRYEQQVSAPSNRAQDGHILVKVMAEHGIFRCLAAELLEAAADLQALECISDTASEYRRLLHGIEHLHAMTEHFEREDDIILPYLRKRGWENLCVAAGNDHAQLKSHIHNLTAFVTSFQAISPAEFRAALGPGVSRFCACLAEHLAFEDDLLWPLALVVIDNPAVWETMKALAEEIGYCGIHAA
jgi:DUF438 domain-containing protein